MTKYVTYTLDDNYLYPFAVSALAIKKHSRYGIRIIQCSEANLGLSRGGLFSAETILKLLDIDYEVVDLKLSKDALFPEWDRFPASTWIRFLAMFDSKFKNETLLYLEPDTLMTDKFTNEGFRTELLAGREVPGHVSEEKQWGAPRRNGYFNCGVMFVNIQKWNEKYTPNEFWNIVRAHDQFKFRIIDQDSINYLLQGEQDPLPVVLNTFPSEYEKDSTEIIHFAGGSKPWIYNNKLLRLKLDKSSKIAFKEWDAIEKELQSLLRKNKDVLDAIAVSKSRIQSNFRRQITLIAPNISKRVANIKKFRKHFE